LKAYPAPAKLQSAKNCSGAATTPSNGDTELAYQGDPETGKPTDGSTLEHHIWYVDRVKALVANQHETVTFLRWI
jgi:hypothetical protein